MKKNKKKLIKKKIKKSLKLKKNKKIRKKRKKITKIYKNKIKKKEKFSIKKINKTKDSIILKIVRIQNKLTTFPKINLKFFSILEKKN